MALHQAPEDLIMVLSRAMRGRSDVRLALLFGSQARGSAGANSDVDVAVDAPADDLLRLVAEVSLATRREVHLADLAGAGYPLKQALVRDSIVLHEGARGAAARWRSRTLLEVVDQRDWYQRMRQAYLKRVSEEGFHHG